MRSRTVKKLLLSCLALLAAGCEPPVTSPGVNPPPVNPPRNTGPSLAFFVQPPSRVITGEVIPAFEVVVLDDDGNPDVSGPIPGAEASQGRPQRFRSGEWAPSGASVLTGPARATRSPQPNLA